MALQLLSGQLLQTVPIPTKDLTGQTIIVTGANSGLGLDAAKHLFRLNCSHIILACRDLGRGEKAKDDILMNRSKTKGAADANKPTISVWRLDMASYASVASFASRASTLPRLDGAVLNAGVSLTEFSLSESLETTLTINVTATFLLAILLVPTLRKSAQATQSSTRLTIIGSQIHHFAKHDQLTSAAAQSSKTGATTIFENLSDPKTAKMPDRYFLSKLLVHLLSNHLAGLLTSSSKTSRPSPDIILNCVNPGYCRTSLFRHDETAVSRVALRVIGRSSEEGSRTLVHGVVEAGPETHGQYLSECKANKTSAFVRSEEGKKVGALLWREVTSIAERVVPGCVERM